MFWSDPTSRFALTLRRLKSRFGWSSPGVQVRLAWPWYWRAASVIVLSGLSLALAGWIYDAGRSFSGITDQENARDVKMLRERVVALEHDLSEARAMADTSVSQLQIEKTTQDRLTREVKKTEDDNVRLKADLAMFENFLGNDAGLASLSISRFRIEPESEAGKYAYHLLVTQQGKDKGREFKGRLQFAILARRGSQTVMIDYPEKDGADFAGFSLNFKYFARLDGILRIPANTIVSSVEVRLVENGAIRARQSIGL